MKKVLLTMLAAAVTVGCGGPWTPPVKATDAEKQGDWTILLCMLRNPQTHIRDAEYYRKVLSEKLHWQGLFVINKGGRSELYWGRYLTPGQARKNLRAAKAHTTQVGTKPFVQAIVVPLPGRDIGPAEWNLKNVRARYTFLVAIFQDVPEKKYIGRKKFAVHYCRRLRKGNYEAYFYHGAPASWVTLGAFGPQAVRTGTGPIGKQVEILDPRIKAFQRDFPRLAVNGTGVNELAWDPQRRKVVRIPQESRLIRIPRD